MKPIQTQQDRDKLWRLADPLTQGVGLDVGVPHFGRCLPLGHLQRRAKANV
jgi:hypothetical protein